jgi:transcriptional regulator with XRE-family HTH domain
MLSQTLAAGLESYEIGPKIRALRLKKNLGLVQLGEHTGMSSGMLSKIERGQLFPTLPTLLKIAMVFGVGLEHFFVDRKDRPTLAVVRKKDRLRLPDRRAPRILPFSSRASTSLSAIERWRPTTRSSNRTRERQSPINIQAQRSSI